LTIWPSSGYVLAMKTVNVAVLKNDLSRYLRAVGEGEEVVVTSHSHAVAKLVPYAASSGLSVRPPTSATPRWKSVTGVKPRKDVDPVTLLLEDRARR
jgi:prevent-host-death family protein